MNQAANDQILSNAPKSTVKKILIPLVIVLVAVLIFIGMKNLAPKPEKTTIDQQPPLVNVTDISSQNIALKVYSQGSVMPVIETSLTA